ncbi:MAG: hypothetical protein DRN19_01990 [Thermoplasmata archaeon]|nr:MAG: hypothetical protein DRN19_01990 [Thermoplasmata archaeon]
MSRGGFAFVVVALLIGAAIPALLTTTQTKGYPASPHYGDAYIGEFWLEEMNITLDTKNSSGYDIAKMVKGHVRAQNDWIVYDANNSIVANYSIQIGDEHPKFNLVLCIEVYRIDIFSLENGSTGGNASLVGTEWQSIECRENTSYDIQGSISFPMNRLNFTGGNLTLVCSLKAVVYTKIKIGLNPVKNLTYMAEDRSVVAVEENENAAGDFSWYVEQASKYLPSPWRYTVDTRGQTVEIQNKWIDEQTVCIVGFPLSGTDENNASQGDSATNGVWDMGHITVVHFWVYVKRIEDFYQYETTKTWVAKKNTSGVQGPAIVNCTVEEYPFAIPSPIPLPVILQWHLHAISGDGRGSGLMIYSPSLKDWWRYGPVHHHPPIKGNVIGLLPEDFNGSSMNVTFRGRIWANLHSRPMGTFTLHILVENDTGNESNGNGNSDSGYNWYWEKGVAYYAKPSYNIVATSFTDGNDITTVKLNIGNYLKNMGDNEIIYTYGADTGDYRVDVCSG